MAIADIFRPKHKHSKSHVRAAAVAAMDHDNIDLLIEIAKGDKDAAIRKSAMAKIDDPDLLAEVAEVQKEAKLRDFAIGLALKSWVADAVSSEDLALAKSCFNKAASHGGDKAIAAIAGEAKLVEVRAQALARLEDERALMAVVRKSSRAEEWKEALSRIDDPALLRSIAIDEKRKEVATAALDRISEPAVLDEVVNKAKNKAVRSKAKRSKAELLRKKSSETTVSDQDKRSAAERKQLARAVEKFAGGDEWIVSRTQVDQAAARWIELSEGAEASIAKRFEKALARYNKNHKIYGETARALLARKQQAEETPAREKGVAAGETEDLVFEKTEAPEANGALPSSATATATEPEVLKASHSEAHSEVQAAQEDLRLDNQDDLERLCEELEELLGCGQIKGFDRALKEADRARRKIGALPKAVEESLRERYEEARRKAVIHLGDLREADDWKRWAAVPKMEALVVRAKALLEEGEDSQRRGEALRTLQREWRNLGASPRAKGEELWKVFKATCDDIYEKVKVEREHRSAEQRENLLTKEALCERAEALQSSTEWQETSEALRELQLEWKGVGPVPRRKSDALWKRFRGACDAFFEARAPQMEEKYSEEAANLEAKTQLVKEIEALSALTCPDEETLREQLVVVRELQRRWRDIGHVARRELAVVSAAYKAACDAVYGKRQVLDEILREAEISLVVELEERIGECADASWDSDAEDVAKKVLAIRQSYRDLNSDIQGYELLGAKVVALIRGQLESEPAAYKGTSLDPERSALARKKLIARAQELAPEPAEEKSQSPEEVAEKLRAALADRALGGVLSKASGCSPSEIVEDLRGTWSELGPVPGPEGTALIEQFEAICQRVLDLAE